MSGFIPEVEGWRAELASRGDLGVYIHHGANDPVIDVGFAREARRQVEDAGIKPTYSESQAAHSIPPEVVDELQAFTADAIPPRDAISVPVPDAPRSSR